MKSVAREAQTVRWGDRLTRRVSVAEVVQSGQLFDVSAPFPTVWRVIAFIEVQNAANFGVSFLLSVGVGIGSSMKDYRFGIPSNTIVSFEIPGQKMWAVIRSDAAIAADTWILDASIAPLVPWRGITVGVEPTGIHGEE